MSCVTGECLTNSQNAHIFLIRNGEVTTWVDKLPVFVPVKRSMSCSHFTNHYKITSYTIGVTSVNIKLTKTTLTEQSPFKF